MKLASGYIEEGQGGPSVTCVGRGLTGSRNRKKLVTCPRDQSHDAQDDVQKLTDRCIQRLNIMQKDKEKDILSV